MNPGFAGFPPEAMTFLRSLKKHNTREWFQPRKEIYDEKGRSVPDTFKNGPKESQLRSLRRYLTDAKQVMLNVANGQFPGPRRKGTGPIEA